MRERAPQNIYSQVSKYICIHTINAVLSYYLWHGAIYDSIIIKHYSLRKIYEYASERSERKFLRFHIQKLLFPSMFCYIRQYNNKRLLIEKNLWICERAERAKIFSVFTFKNYYFLQYSVGTYDTLSQKHIFSGLKIHLHTYNQCSSLILLMAWSYIRHYNNKTLYSLRKIYEYASERSERKKKSFSHSKTTISFNILLVLMILCLRNIYFQVSNYMHIKL